MCYNVFIEKTRWYKMKFKIDYDLDLQLLHELACLYLYKQETEQEKVTVGSFKKYVKQQLRAYGFEFAGLGVNGYMDLEMDIIVNANKFLLKEFGDLCDGTVNVYSYDSSKDFKLVFSAQTWKMVLR